MLTEEERSQKLETILKGLYHPQNKYASELWCKDPEMKVADMRGWGSLIGHGHTGQRLEAEDAMAIQDAIADRIVHAVACHEELVNALETVMRLAGDYVAEHPVIKRVVTEALSKAKADISIRCDRCKRPFAPNHLQCQPSTDKWLCDFCIIDTTPDLEERQPIGEGFDMNTNKR